MQVLLVLGAAGGVGLSAVQIGKLLGAVVIGVARYTQALESIKACHLLSILIKYYSLVSI